MAHLVIGRLEISKDMVKNNFPEFGLES
jgi:hypothetical protein